MTAELVPLEVVPLDEAHARKLTLRIGLLLGTLLDHRDKLVILMTEAREGAAHLALGYRSWTEYMSTEFADMLPRLGVDDRREVVGEMTAAGMSTRAIAPIVGVSYETVAQDLRAPVRNLTPVPFESARVNLSTGEIVDGRTITGIDGKTYTPPVHAPKVARQRPLPDAYRDALYDLRKIVQRVERLTDDPRFLANRPRLVECHLHELTGYGQRVVALALELETGLAPERLVNR